MDVFLNGKMIPQNQATISANDAALQHAVGLFETLSAYNSTPFRLQQHLDRLKNSAQTLGMTADINTDPLADAVQQTITHNNLTEARIRLTLTPGPINLIKPTSPDSPEQAPKPTILITADHPTKYDPAYFDKGISTIVIPNAANPFDQLQGHKTLAYWSRLRTLRMAAAAGAGEAIWLSISNHLASGAVSNIFLVKDNTLYTPIAKTEEVEGAIPAPVLPGVTRATVIEIADKLNLDTKKQMLTIEDLLEADEVFLTNSSWQILPVTKIEKKEISAGKVGPVTAQLRNDLLDVIEKETTI